jgi:hypothetical protein
MGTGSRRGRRAAEEVAGEHGGHVDGEGVDLGSEGDEAEVFEDDGLEGARCCYCCDGSCEAGK